MRGSPTKVPAICDEDMGLGEFQFGRNLVPAAVAPVKKESSLEVPVASPPALDPI